MKKKKQPEQLITYFLNSLKGASYSLHTIRAYEKDIRQFFSFLNKNKFEIEQVKRDDIRNYLLYLSGENYSSRTVARKLASLKGFMKYLLKEKVIFVNPMILIQTPKITKKLPQFLYLREIQLLRSNINTSNPLELRDLAIIETLYSSGIRVSELTHIKTEDIAFDKGIIKVMGKGNKERVTFIGKKSLEILKKYTLIKKKISPNETSAFFISKKGERLNPSQVWHIIKKISRKLPMTRNISPHSFRHSFASHLLDGGADIRSVQELLGHRNLSTTQIYTHISKEKLKQIYHSCHPHG